MYLALLGLMHAKGTASVRTSDSGPLRTWWHENYVRSDLGAIPESEVRRSVKYNVSDSLEQHDMSAAFDSFTYLSLPRGGKEKWGYSTEDGAETATDYKMTMSWSQFLYSVPVVVYVSVADGSFKVEQASEVIIRPQIDGLEVKRVSDDTVALRLPYSPAGYRFSVEFKADLVAVYSDKGFIHEQPRNALLVFAEPLSDDTSPNTAAADVYSPPTGLIDTLHDLPDRYSTIYFGPGTYYMPWNYRAYLPNSIFAQDRQAVQRSGLEKGVHFSFLGVLRCALGLLCSRLLRERRLGVPGHRASIPRERCGRLVG